MYVLYSMRVHGYFCVFLGDVRGEISCRELAEYAQCVCLFCRCELLCACGCVCVSVILNRLRHSWKTEHFNSTGEPECGAMPKPGHKIHCWVGASC